jgi:hypothetical protein
MNATEIFTNDPQTGVAARRDDDNLLVLGKAPHPELGRASTSHRSTAYLVGPDRRRQSSTLE